MGVDEVRPRSVTEAVCGQDASPDGYVRSSRMMHVDARDRTPSVVGDDAEAMVVPDERGRQLPTFPVRASASAIAAALEAVDPADLSAHDLVEWVAGWHQLAAIVTAEQARGVLEATTRRGVLGDYVIDELACALVVTRQAVQTAAGRAAGMHAYPVLSDALMRGRIDARKVDVILHETFMFAFDDVSRAEVIAQAVSAADGLTAPQLARYVRRLMVEVDPALAERREKAARKERGVELRMGPDSMAWVSAYLPAASALAAYTVVEALAAHKVPGDARGVDARRADAFADVFGAILDSERGPDGSPLPRRHGQRAAVNVTVAASTLLGLDDLPAELHGYGPIPASVAREIAQDGTWRRILTEPSTGAFLERTPGTYRPGADLTRTVQARDVTCTYPGCRQPALRGELDHIEPFDHGGGGGGRTTEANLHVVCKHHHQAKTAKLWNVRRDKATGNTVWTSPLGITYARSPVASYVAADTCAGVHRKHAADGPPPF